MSWTKYKIGQLINTVDERNNSGVSDFYGININKEFMPTVANTEGLDASKYKVVRKNRFVFSGMQTGRDVCIRISMYTQDNPVIVSPAYTTFEVSSTDVVIPMYFFMYFLSSEKDRLGWFFSDGSVRSNLDWDRFCDIELEIPDIQTQKKYVDLYQAFIANQQSYERGLEDLKLVCEGYFDVAKKQQTMSLGSLIESVDQRNVGNVYSQVDVKGITNNKEFSETRADVSSVDLRKFKIVHPGQFAYNSRTDGRDMLVLALNREDKPVIVTFNYNTFRIRPQMSNTVDANYLYAYFRRSEFDRKVRFSSWGSSQELLSWDNLCGIQVPVPDIVIQRSIAEIMNVYLARTKINERLKTQIKELCPILIRGSLSDGG